MGLALDYLMDASDGAGSGYVEGSESDDKWCRRLEDARAQACAALNIAADPELSAQPCVVVPRKAILDPSVYDETDQHLTPHPCAIECQRKVHKGYPRCVDANQCDHGELNMEKSIADLIDDWYEGGSCDQKLDEAKAQIRKLENALPVWAKIDEIGKAIAALSPRAAPTAELIEAGLDVVKWLDSKEVTTAFKSMGNLSHSHPHLSAKIAPEFSEWAAKVLRRFRTALDTTEARLSHTATTEAQVAALLTDLELLNFMEPGVKREQRKDNYQRIREFLISLAPGVTEPNFERKK